MILEYDAFVNKLNETLFEGSSADLLSKIVSSPDRYVGIFRPTKPKTKLIQNITQSHEIKFGDALENIFEDYFRALGFEMLPKRLSARETKDNKDYDIDQLFKKVGEHYPYIPVSDALNPDSINAINLNPNTDTLKTLWDQYRNIDNEIRTFLGIQNQCNSDKKERLIVDEVNSNNEITNDYLYLRLRQREDFCKKINDFFGLNVSVKVNKSREFSLIEQTKPSNEKGGNENAI